MDTDQTLQRELHHPQLTDETAPEVTPESLPAVDPLAIEPSGGTVDAKSGLLLWLQLLWQHPLVFWGGIWVLLLLIAGIAVTSLMNPELSKLDRPNDRSDTTLADQPTLFKNDSERTVPMWSIGAIVLSCTFGSIMLSQRLKQTNQKRSLKAKSKALASSSPLQVDTKDLTETSSVSEILDVRSTQSSSTSTSSMPTFPDVALSASGLTASSHASAQELARTAVVQTAVVPDHESTPLDWEDAGLAEIMDIRYRRNRSH